MEPECIDTRDDAEAAMPYDTMSQVSGADQTVNAAIHAD
jgi:hypothetical protein